MDSIMDSSMLLCSYLLVFLLGGGLAFAKRNNTSIINSSFDHNYDVTWGNDHVFCLNQGREVQLSMDNSSGAGFQSKLSYNSGFFHTRIKLPGNDSAGVVTTFYVTYADILFWQLTSHSRKHDELDFEFLGNKKGKPYTLQTNVFSNGEGDREQRFHLWFDPTTDFHSYGILWNPHQIVFYVDNTPIRVYENKTNMGVSYPTQPMQVEASLWDGDSWATNGGQTKTNWSCAPFKAHFQGFNIDGCLSKNYSSQTQPCYSSNYWWNREKYSKLDPPRRRLYETVREKYMNYDYCNDRNRYPTRPRECP